MIDPVITASVHVFDALPVKVRQLTGDGTEGVVSVELGAHCTLFFRGATAALVFAQAIADQVEDIIAQGNYDGAPQELETAATDYRETLEKARREK